MEDGALNKFDPNSSPKNAIYHYPKVHHQSLHSKRFRPSFMQQQRPLHSKPQHTSSRLPCNFLSFLPLSSHRSSALPSWQDQDSFKYRRRSNDRLLEEVYDDDDDDDDDDKQFVQSNTLFFCLVFFFSFLYGF